MSTKTEKLAEELSSLSVLELSELKEMLKDKWGVEAMAAPVAMAMPAGGGAAAPAAEESTDFQVTLASVDAAKKIGVIKVVREVTGLGLKEAKDLVEGAPGELKAKAPKAEAEEIKKKIEEAGGKVTLKGL